MSSWVEALRAEFYVLTGIVGLVRIEYIVLRKADFGGRIGSQEPRFQFS